MPKYRVQASGDIKTQSELRLENSNVSFPKVWNEGVYEQLGVDPVLPTSAPDPSGPYKKVALNGAEQNSDGNWVEAWVEQDMTDEEKAAYDQQKADAERRTRDGLLASTDYLALVDATLTDAMRTYRQALRDVPQQEGFPNTITWPTKPS